MLLYLFFFNLDSSQQVPVIAINHFAIKLFLNCYFLTMSLVPHNFRFDPLSIYFLSAIPLDDTSCFLPFDVKTLFNTNVS